MFLSHYWLYFISHAKEQCLCYSFTVGDCLFIVICFRVFSRQLESAVLDILPDGPFLSFLTDLVFSHLKFWMESKFHLLVTLFLPSNWQMAFQFLFQDSCLKLLILEQELYCFVYVLTLTSCMRFTPKVNYF